jgi:hypothetical protein
MTAAVSNCRTGPSCPADVEAGRGPADCGGERSSSALTPTSAWPGFRPSVGAPTSPGSATGGKPGGPGRWRPGAARAQVRQHLAVSCRGRPHQQSLGAAGVFAPRGRAARTGQRADHHRRAPRRLDPPDRWWMTPWSAHRHGSAFSEQARRLPAQAGPASPTRPWPGRHPLVRGNATRAPACA